MIYFRALHVVPLLLLSALLFCGASSFAGDPRIRVMADSLPSANTGSELESYSFSTRKGEVKTSIQCLGGYKFAVVSSVGHNAAPQPAVMIIQIQEDVTGRVVPAKC